MKKIKAFGFVFMAFGAFALASCSGNGNTVTIENTTQKITTSSPAKDEFNVKTVNFYREKDKPEKQISLRFYENTPNVPYIGVKDFYKTFYKTDYKVEQEGNLYTFKREACYITLDTNQDTIEILGIDKLGIHPDFISENTRSFVLKKDYSSTTARPFFASLKNYGIEIYGEDGEAYVPFQFIANVTSGTSAYCLSYNEKDIYEFDAIGQMDGVARLDEYYGDSYGEVIYSNTERKEDLIQMSYNMLCFEIDQLRGYTEQMAFVDNNILSIGLNGTLEKYYPRVKELLLSKDRIDYLLGVYGLFCGLSDGGHTSLFAISKVMVDDSLKSRIQSEPELQDLTNKGVFSMIAAEMKKENLLARRQSSFGEDAEGYYYKHDDATKTSFIGFDSFEVNYQGWDNYYSSYEKNGEGVIPVNDSFAYVRSKLYESLDNGTENVVIDLSTNGGGDSAALMGVFALLTSPEVTFSRNNVAEKTREEEKMYVDINLDGVIDNKDSLECEKFKALNISILTSSCSFSCGNLLPSILKEKGFKIIGEQSGGGSCAIMLGSTLDGFTYARSSYLCLSNSQGNNIDGGVPVDLALIEVTPEGKTINHFYDFEYLNGKLA